MEKIPWIRELYKLSENETYRFLLALVIGAVFFFMAWLEMQDFFIEKEKSLPGITIIFFAVLIILLFVLAVFFAHRDEWEENSTKE